CLPRHLPVLLHLDVSNLRKDDLPIFDPHNGLALSSLNLGIGEGVIAVISLKTGISGLLSLLHAPEEVLERFLHSMQGILQNLCIDLVKLRSVLFDCWELSRLHLKIHTHPTHTPGFTSFL